MDRTSSAARYVLSGLLMTLASGAALAQAPALVPAEAYGSLPAISDVQLSPDGKHFSALQTYQGRAAVVIYEIGAPPGTTPAILIDDTHYIKDARWGSNERLLVQVYESMRPDVSVVRTYPVTRTFSVDVTAKNPVMLFKNLASTHYNLNSSIIKDLNLDEPNRVVMPMWAEHARAFSWDLYKVDITTGMSEPFARGKQIVTNVSDEHTADWVMDGHGHAVARIDQSGDPLVDHLKLNKDGSWQEVQAFDAEADNGADTVGLSEDGTQIIRFENGNTGGTEAVVGYEIATGKTVPVFKDAKYDVAGLFVNEWTRRALAAVYTSDTYQVRFFTPEMQAMQRGLENAFPGQTVILQSESQNFDKVIVRVSSASEPHTYYLLDRKTHFAGRIGGAYPGLHSQDLGVVKPYPYKARDGLDIPAYLTLPPGKAPKDLPVVVFPHGGPEARDSMDFNWWTQFMANRGYAVLQPNYRGSSGYGYAFRKAGFHQWGLKMQDDLTDGVRKLIADGIADPKRICIVGASYGGYAAMAGAAFTPDLYACAVSVAGVTDLPKLLDSEEWDSGVKSKTMSYIHSRIGSASEDMGRLEATSPALHADKIKCPVLLMHGNSDYTVRVDQSVEMYGKLKALGKSVEFIRFEGDEDHYLERADTRIRMLKAIEKFLQDHIGN